MKLHLIIACILLSISISFAQPYPRQIQTRLVEQEMLKLESVRQQKNDIERYVSKHKPYGELNTKTIPLIFHVLYATTEEQVSTAQIYAQIEALNTHFNGLDANQHSIIAEKEGFDQLAAENGHIQFCLANYSNGTETNINYHQTTISNWSTDPSIKQASLGATPIAPERFLNIWIAHLEDNISGYATMPWAPEALDGIVIDYRFFGTFGAVSSPYDEGKTLTHLIGNYLGLYDLWSDQCLDDQVSDTPIHNAPNIGCPVYKHVTTCYEHPVEMTMNFMDNTDDACMYMFTEGQLLRMHSILNGPRSSLAENGSLTNCQTPVPTLVEADKNTIHLDQASKVVSAFKIQPNPADEEVEILLQLTSVLNTSTIQITVFSANGMQVFSKKFDQQSSIKIPTADWVPGIYYLKGAVGGESFSSTLAISR